MANELTFTVAISTFNRNPDLERCLAALEKQTHKDFDVVIANGGVYEDVRRAAGQFPSLKIRIINQERRGIVEARNLGWRNSTADIVCFIDDDLVPAGDWLENIRRAFQADNSIGGVSGPTIIPPDRQRNRDQALFMQEFSSGRNLFLRLFGRFYLWAILENRQKEVGRILKSGFFTPGSNYPGSMQLPSFRDVDYLEACHMCFRRKLIEEAGGFDYIYEGTGEWSEPDLSFKIRAKGYRLIFNPKAVTYHYISQAGVYKARTNSYERSKNFIFFYMRWIKPNTPEKAFRFGMNMLFINFYWCYKFLQSGNPDWLNGFAGTFAGFRKAGALCRS